MSEISKIPRVKFQAQRENSVLGFGTWRVFDEQVTGV